MAATTDTGILPGWLSGITDPGSWLKGIGGGIASGIEAGFEQFITGLWNVILGPLEILTGAIIALIALNMLMNNNLFALAPFIA